MNLPAPKESEIQRQIAEWLTLNGYLVIRCNPGVIKRQDKAGRVHHYKNVSADGMTDLIAVRGGKIAFIEVKRPGGKTDKRRQLIQNEFIDRCRAAGALAFYARSLAEVVAALWED